MDATIAVTVALPVLLEAGDELGAALVASDSPSVQLDASDALAVNLNVSVE